MAGVVATPAHRRVGAVMRLEVTRLGASGRSVAAVARGVVGYLDGGRDDPGVALLVGDDSNGDGGGMVAYYGDSAEGSGRWISPQAGA